MRSRAVRGERISREISEASWRKLKKRKIIKGCLMGRERWLVIKGKRLVTGARK